MNFFDKNTWKNRYTRFSQWEYWPYYTFYIPLFMYYLLLVIRARHAFFLTAANPAIFTGGTGMESKYNTLMKLPAELRPKTILIKPGEDVSLVKIKLNEAQISFPLIAKPDVGYRGLLVKKIKTEKELFDYLRKYKLDFLVQELIDLPVEAGLLYYRFPDEEKGKITSITLKDFLSVTGDGQKTVLDLVQEYDRALLQLERLQQTHKEVLSLIPKKGEKIQLGSIGNHSKGTTFINGNHLIKDIDKAVYDKLNHQIEGIYFCRYDLLCSSIEDLKTGNGIKIIEVNGIGAEPTHIYDVSKCSFFCAIKTIGQHWTLIWKLGIANHQKGVPYFPFIKMIKTLLAHRRYIKSIKKMVA